MLTYLVKNGGFTMSRHHRSPKFNQIWVRYNRTWVFFYNFPYGLKAAGSHPTFLQLFVFTPLLLPPPALVRLPDEEQELVSNEPDLFLEAFTVVCTQKKVIEEFTRKELGAQLNFSQLCTAGQIQKVAMLDFRRWSTLLEEPKPTSESLSYSFQTDFTCCNTRQMHCLT